MYSMKLRSMFMRTVALVALLLTVATAQAQETTEAPTAETVITEIVVVTEEAPVVVVPPEVMDEIREEAETNTVALLIVLFSAVLLAFGAFAGVVIRYVARLVPAELAGMVYSGGNAFYSFRQKQLEELRQRGLANDISWDDPFLGVGVSGSRQQWQAFIDEAKAKGVVLPPIVETQLSQGGVSINGVQGDAPKG